MNERLPDSPPEWRLRGYRVAVEHKPDQGFGTGETRTEALRALDRALAASEARRIPG